MTCTNFEVWRGWAEMVAKEPSLGDFPDWILENAHPKCANPRLAWAGLLGAARDQLALLNESRTPSEICNTPLTTSEQAVWSIEARAKVAAASLAWGDESG